MAQWELTDDEAEKLLQDCEEKWNESEKYHKDQFRLWRENIAFIEDLQWIKSNERGFLNVQGSVRNRVRIVDNRLLDNARRLHSRLSSVKYSPVVFAETNDPNDKMAARVGNSSLRWFERTKAVPRAKRLANWWLVVCGVCYLEPYFDPDAGPEEEVQVLDEETGQPVMVPVMDENGQPVMDTDPLTNGPLFEADGVTPKVKKRPQTTMKKLGDPDFVVRSPFQIRRDPRFQDWKKLRWIFVEEWAAKEDVLDKFQDVPGLETKIKEHAQKYQAAPWMPDASFDSSDATGIPKGIPTVEDVTQIKRFYERPCRKYPKGRLVIYTPGKILWAGDLDGMDFPLVKLGYLDRPWILEGKSVLSSGKVLQRLYNRIFSRYAEHLIRLPAGWLLVPVTSGIPRRAFTNETGSVIRYAPGGGKPEFVFPPFQGLAWYDRFLDRIEGSIEERMALPPASRGQLPRGARAARTVELLQEAADQVQGPVLDDLADGWSDFYFKVLEIMYDKFEISRLMSVVGEDKRADVVEFKKESFPADWRNRLGVRVEAGESLPSTKLMRMELILTLASRHGMFGEIGTPEYIRKLSRALDLDAGFLSNEEDLDVSIAEDENLKIDAGEQVKVRPFDNDVAHLYSHLSWMKRKVIEGDEDAAMRVWPHVQEHQKSVVVKAGAAGPSQNKPIVKQEPGGQQPVEKQVTPLGENTLGNSENVEGDRG